MAKRDYYEVLGVVRTATDIEITKAYRGLAKKYHPDQNPGDETVVTRYHEVTEAYEVLRDPQKRQVYDRYGHEGLSQRRTGGDGRRRSLRGLRRSPRRALRRRRRRGGGVADPRRGADIEDVLDVELLEAATGVKKSFTVRFEANCKACGGNGAKPGTQAAPCKRCKGSGAEYVQAGGLFSFPQACRGCGGRGVVIPDPCPTCRGAGRVETRETVSIDLPPGVDTRVRLTVPGHGHEGAPGARAATWN